MAFDWTHLNRNQVPPLWWNCQLGLNLFLEGPDPNPLEELLEMVGEGRFQQPVP